MKGRLKKITLLRLNMGDYRTRDAFPPLALGILAARTPRDLEVAFYDDRCEVVPLDEPTDLVAMSVETFTARRAYKLASIYRARGIPVVMGGHHPTLLPEEAMRHADAVVTGDAEGAWEQLIDDFRHGRPKTLYKGSRGFPQGSCAADKLSLPVKKCEIDRSIFEGKRYAPAHLIQYRRGCRHDCEFCSVRAFYGGALSRRSPEAVAREIVELKRRNPRRLFMFVDDNLYASPSDLTDLLEVVWPLDIRWACQISADVAKHPALLDRMGSSGCTIALIGFESLDGRNMEAMNKGWARRCGDNLEIVRAFHDRGIAVCGTFVLGYDGDGAESVAATVDFVRRARLELAQLNPLVPLPGTRLYKRLLAQGRILRPLWWIEPSYRYGDPVVAPLGTDPDEFARMCYDAKRQIYSWAEMARRVFLPYSGFNLRRMGLVGFANLLSRHEVRRKQFRLVGV